MNNTTKFSCVLDTTDSACPLGMEIWVDDQKIFDQNHISNAITFEYDLVDDDGEHELKFLMKGKTHDHTKINEAGEIVSDARLVIKEVIFEEIKLGHVFSELATYSHDFNGTTEKIQDKFYGEMGCNGTVSIKFTTPIYIWLLENM